MTDNEQNFILLHPSLGWKTSLIKALHRGDNGLSIQEIPGEDTPLKDRYGNFGGLDYPSGLAVDGENNVYIADTNHHLIKKFDICNKEFITLECLGGQGHLPRHFDSPQGLAISEKHDLYVADTGNHRVQVFSLKGLVLRRILGYVDADGMSIGGSGGGQFDSPTDIALDSRGNIYVVDKGNCRVQRFSREGKFQLKFGGEGYGEGEFQCPTHIVIDREDRIYVIDEARDCIQVFDTEGNFITKVGGVSEVADSFEPLSMAIDNIGNVYVTKRHYGMICRYVFEAGLGQEPSYTGYSISYDSEISYLILDNAGNLYAALRDRGMVTKFEPKKTSYEEEGYFISEAIDSEIYRCQWHRIVTEADIPEGTSIGIYTRTSEQLKDNTELDQLPDSQWSRIHINTNDSMIMSPPGRYLWLKVVLRGNIKSTPVLKSLKIYYPRVTYLRYLPKVYQEDETSRDFLARFLSIFETALSGFEDKIANIASYFNAATAPAADFLPWLASWIGLVLEQSWPEEKRRELIKMAPELYKIRGTMQGIKKYIEIYTGLKSHLNIIEHYRLRRWLFLDDGNLRGDAILWGEGLRGERPPGEANSDNSRLPSYMVDPVIEPFLRYAHKFSVVVPWSFCDPKSKEHAIRRIIEIEKPAHTEYSICRVEPKLRVGVQSTIGVDTIIGNYPVIVLGVGSTLGIDSILGQSPEEKGAPILRIGKNSRIGVDTLIN